MNEKLRAHVEKMFEDAPRTNRVTELKEELLANLNDKYNDLIANNYNENEAYQMVIAGIGDINDLLKGLRYDPLDMEQLQKTQKRSAFMVALSIFLYVISIIAIVILEPYGDEIALISFLAIAGLSTCILVYHFMSRPKYLKKDDTIVEDFKEWKSGKSSRNKLRNSIISIVWTLSLVVYFIVSFAFNNWEISWIIFIVAALVSQIIKLIFDMKA